MILPNADLAERAQRVRLLLLDVDGVLTDGSVSIGSDGHESKRFFIRDGLAVKWAQRHGLEVGLLSGRSSDATTSRARELGIELVVQGGPEKREPFLALLAARGLTPDQVAYMGDDLVDLPVMTRVGLAAAPSDAVAEVVARAHWVSAYPGGRGAVREFIELILQARGQWNAMLAQYQD
jgi:3-deoxy-D-manno-octulosonate 8-phosphate phosphatase (KDO 8-P phosphatase)